MVAYGLLILLLDCLTIYTISENFQISGLRVLFSMASYLYKIHIPANRKAMTRLRLSSHKLMIEGGRWLNILPKDRLCTLCNKLEDEFHVICEFHDTIHVENYILSHITLENQAWIN